MMLCTDATSVACTISYSVLSIGAAGWPVGILRLISLKDSETYESRGLACHPRQVAFYLALFVILYILHFPPLC